MPEPPRHILPTQLIESGGDIRKPTRRRGRLVLLLTLSMAALGQAPTAEAQTCDRGERNLASMPRIIFTDPTIEVEPVTEHERSTLRVRIPEGGATVGGVALVDRSLANGSIEVDLLSRLADDAPEGSRGFAGIAFRAAPDASRYEAIYLRPTNGRARDQIRRNHSTQYISYPDYPWHRLREEAPGHYESYVDLQLGVWTRLRLEIAGDEALLFVNGGEQPALVVRDLKLGSERSGQVGLWIGSGTIAHFAGLRVNGC